MLSILLFGSPQLFIDRRPLPLLWRKNRALVYYLAAHAQPVTRDSIMTPNAFGHQLDNYCLAVDATWNIVAGA